jgi:N-acetylmuramoyl-L-alanine amidase
MDEAEYVLDFCAELCPILDGAGMSPTMTREEDVALQHTERNKIAVSNKAEMVISVHVNAAPSPSLHGAMVFYWSSNKKTRAGADAIARAIPDGLRRTTAAVHSVGPYCLEWLERARYVVESFRAPAVLVELGFATNHYDAEMLSKDRIKIGLQAAILSGLARMI